MAEPEKRGPTPQEMLASGRSLVTLLLAMAEDAASIAHARRTLYLAYVDEGFTEAQAMELVMKVI